jgi:hypothetical protein
VEKKSGGETSALDFFIRKNLTLSSAQEESEAAAQGEQKHGRRLWYGNVVNGIQEEHRTFGGKIEDSGAFRCDPLFTAASEEDQSRASQNAMSGSGHGGAGRPFANERSSDSGVARRPDGGQDRAATSNWIGVHRYPALQKKMLAACSEETNARLQRSSNVFFICCQDLSF